MEKNELIEFVLQYGIEQLEYASEDLLGDREFIEELVKVYDGDYQDILEYASEEIQRDESFISELSTVKENRKLEQESIKIMDSDEEISEYNWEAHDMEGFDENELYEMITSGDYEKAIKYIEKSGIKIEDKKIILELIKYDAIALKYASDNFKDNRDFIVQLLDENAILKDGILKFASDDIRENIEYIDKLRTTGIEISYEEILYYDKLVDNEQFIINLFPNYTADSDILEFVSKELLEDESFMEEVIGYHHGAIDYLSDELKNNANFIMRICENSSYFGRDSYSLDPLEIAGEELLKNKDFILRLLRKDYCLPEDLESNEIMNNRDFIIEAIVAGFPDILEYVSEELRGDKEVILEAVRQDGYALEYASVELRGDKEVVLEAVRQDEDALEFASEELKNDQEILKILEEQEKQKAQHTPQEIAQGINPTQSEIEAVQEEMIAQQTKEPEEIEK